MHGCCLERMTEIPDGSVDMVLCDLPYGTTVCKWDAVIPFEPMWAAYRRICKKNAAIVLTANQPFTSALVMSNAKAFKYEWIWKKNRGTNPLSVNFQPLRNHESVLVFYQSAPTYNPQMTSGKPYGGFKSSTNADIGKIYRADQSRHRDNPTGSRFPLSTQEFAGERGLHPTQKPVALMEYLIRTYTNSGETVLDNTMGSGTTGVACVNTGRRFIGIERDPKYFQIASERISKISR